MAERFVRESRLAGSLNHPNIVTVLEYFEDGGVPYIAMEYVPRGSLRPYVGHLSPAQVAGVMEGVLAGLAHAEMHGIVHRDLKPENLMVTSDGRVKIADFGIAKATASAATGAFVTAKGTTVGTPAYMAPEQAMGQEVGAWSDLYSVGAMAWEQVVGHTPFHDTDAPMAILMRHVNEPIPPVVDVAPDADPHMSEWIERLLVKDAAQRTQSPTEAWEELEEIVISQLGPRWRRDARLPSYTEVLDTPKPLTPAPFVSARAPTPTPLQVAAASSGYLTFGKEAEAPVADVTPTPAETPVTADPTYVTFGGSPEPEPRARPEPEPEPELGAESELEPTPEPEPVAVAAPEPEPVAVA
ncbi:MAG: serine/threonine-protein kinase, partial [Solirubrobacterales bacterium]